ncbi:MAG: integrase catalytic domain-containing protein [Halothiobacillaceae bacterium]
MAARNQYLEALRKAYERAAGREAKGRLLDEAEERTGLNRKVLIRKLRAPAAGRKPGRRAKRKATYDGAVAVALVKIWELFDYPCGQRLAPVLKRELHRLRKLGEVLCSDEVAAKLARISWRTIDRLLRHEKQVRYLTVHRNPAVHPLLYERIPVKTAAEWDTSEVGNLQIDYVPHCGSSAAGHFLHTLSTVDIATLWWEGQAIAGRSQQATREGLDAIRVRLPFPIRELHPDNDSGMINDLMWRYCQDAGIRMSRSRPYQKNDNAWVEQKNWTHVRKVVGYRRLTTDAQREILNTLYPVLALYKNFFQPAIKLKAKLRVRGKIHRMYGPAETPYERLLASGQLDNSTAARLKQLYESVNPAELHRRIEALRGELFRLVEGTEPRLPARRGPPAWILTRLLTKPEQTTRLRT